MAARQQPKVLRIGVLQGRQIVEDKLHRTAGTISVGESPRSTILVLGDEENVYPKQFELFRYRGGRYFLQFKKNMKGRVKVGQAEEPLADLVTRRIAVPKGDTFELPLPEEARGQVTIGDVTFLFNFVTAPPLPARPRLPESLRGGFIKTLDWPFLRAFTPCFVAGVVFWALVNTTEIPKVVVTAEQVADRIAEMQNIPRPEKPPEPVETPVDENATGPAVAQQEETPADDLETDRQPQSASEARDREQRRAEELARMRAQMAEQARNVGLVSLIGARGPGGDQSSFVSDVLGDGGRFDQSLQVLREVNGVGVRQSSADVNLASGSARPRTQNIEVAGVGGAQTGGNEPARAERVRGRVSASGNTQQIGGHLDERGVKAVIMRKVGELQQCYEQQLRVNPRMAGRVEVMWTVTGNGAVSDPQIVNSQLGNRDVETCIISRIRRWRFSPPQDGADVTLIFPFIFQSAGQ